MGFLKMILGDPNQKELKKIQRIVDQVNALEEEIQRLPDTALKLKTGEFKERLARGETTAGLLPEAFAVVREASRRTLGMRPFDVQITGATVLHQGRIAEMKTGEGKTLAATLPAYLNALTGEGVHIITVNDYLARRDSEWMGEIYKYLGLKTGLIVHGLDSSQRKEAYAADIIYGTNNEFGFDYLRDNMAVRSENLVQRALSYAIVDEVDSILIDEARTPLIISGQVSKSTELYKTFAMFVPRLKLEQDYTIDEKAHSVILTEEGISRAEKFLGLENLYDDTNMEHSHHLNQALKAQVLMKRDRNYVVKDGEIVIVDEFTGRLMFGRRYSDGLHQAIEAKEGVKVARESQTLASITFQNYFRMYTKLAGMTGTAVTEEEEFMKIYNLDVVVIPTNEPMIREELSDVVYKTERGKFRAVVEEIVTRNSQGQPLLVGTISIEKSEELSTLLDKRGVRHNVLNAKQHEREAEIVKDAGQRGGVTIATNMAGRGTDIVLGEGVTDLGGLHIIGTERHESRRIDNQLRGRSGRQGDPGSAQFYISLEDDLMRIFGGESISNIMEKLGVDEDQPIDHSLISKAIENAQKKVEGRNFDIRKYVLEYDDVINQQREVIYKQRRRVLEGESLKETVQDMIREVAVNSLDNYCDEKIYPEEWDLKGLLETAENLFLPLGSLTEKELAEKEREEIAEIFLEKALNRYAAREKELGEENLRELERVILLRLVDTKWMDHIDIMDNLRHGIGLRAYGQRNPLMEYKKEAYDLFQGMIASIREEMVKLIYRVQIVSQLEHRAVAGEATASLASSGQAMIDDERGEAVGGEPPKVQPRRVVKIGRNEPCPCGSGKKYKKCCERKESR